MTWRERIVAARERGYFTTEEKRLASLVETCAVGEARNQTGLTYTSIGRVSDTRWLDLPFTAYVCKDDFDGAEKILDEIEDRVLQLKREQIT